MTRPVLSLVLAGLLFPAAACDNSSDSSSLPTIAAPTVTETLSGVVPAPVSGGAQQSSFVTFTSSAAGTGSITITSAVETFTNGSINLGVVVGLQLGVPNAAGTACTLASGSSPLFVQASALPISAPLVAGANCLLVTSGDQSALAGPVAYTAVVVHL